jgi:oligopeptide transport system permease protein
LSRDAGRPFLSFMLRFAVRRFFQAIPVMLVIVTATFFMVRFVPGGPFTSEKAISPEILRSLEAHYGLDQPLWRQYANYLGQLVRGNLGPSFKYTNRTVNEIIADKLPVSLELGGLALLVAIGLGIPLGVVAAVRRNTALDYICSAIGMIGICVPTFVLGPLLALLFGIHLRWLNVSGWYFAADRILPALTLGFVYAAYLMRLTRGGMLEVLSQDFIRTARAKGAPETTIIFRHALRGGLLPVVAFLGPAIAGILTGSFVIETIFQIPGLGREFVNSAFSRDYTLVLGTVILYAALIVLLNLVADIVQVWLNPKLKFE